MTRNNSGKPGTRAIAGVIVKAAAALAVAAIILVVSMHAATRTTATITSRAMSGIAAVQAKSASATPRNGALEPSVVKTSDDFARAMLSGDARAVASMFREDGIEMPNGAPLVRGRAAIEQRYRELFSAPARFTTFAFSHLESTVLGDIAYDAGTYDLSLSLPAKTVNDSGKFVVILKRTQGQWKAAFAIYNSNTAQAPSSPTRD